MKNTKQYLIEEISKKIVAKEKEIEGSNQELEILNVRLKVEEKILSMQDLKEYLRKDFKSSVQNIDEMVFQEKDRNSELKKELEMLQYRKKVIENKFSENELDE